MLMVAQTLAAQRLAAQMLAWQGRIAQTLAVQKGFAIVKAESSRMPVDRRRA